VRQQDYATSHLLCDGLLAHLAANLLAGMLGHADEALSLAGSLTLAGIIGGLAIVVTLALVDAIAMYLGILTSVTGYRGKGKQTGGRHGQGYIGGFACFHAFSSS
jgi:hypothetical protein